MGRNIFWACACLLYTSDAADERSSVDLGGRRIIKKKNMHRLAVIHAKINTKNKHNMQQEINEEKENGRFTTQYEET